LLIAADDPNASGRLHYRDIAQRRQERKRGKMQSKSQRFPIRISARNGHACSGQRAIGIRGKLNA
jgi:hypothetical protein